MPRDREVLLEEVDLNAPSDVGRTGTSLEDVSLETPHQHIVTVEESERVVAAANGSGKGTSSIAEVSYNVVNCIIGAGIIGLPFAMKEAGFFLGLILLASLAYLTDVTTRILIVLAKVTSTRSYSQLSFSAFGTPGYWAVTCFQFVMAFGAMTAYLVVIGDTVPVVLGKYFGEAFFGSREWMILFPCIFIMLPLSLSRDMAQLSKWSFVSVMAVVFIVCAVFVRGPQVSPYKKAPPKGAYDFAHSHFFQATGVISFAFVFHHSAFVFYESLHMNTLKRWAKVAHSSVFVAFVASTILALCGYIAFYDQTKANLLNNFSHDDHMMNVTRMFFALTMFLTYPLEAFLARRICEEAILVLKQVRASGSSKLTGDQLSTAITLSQQDNPKTRYTATTVFVLLSLVVALSTSNLGVVFELVGGFAAVALAYVLPAILHLRLIVAPVFSRKQLHALLIFVFGLIDMIATTLLTISGVAGPAAALGVYAAIGIPVSCIALYRARRDALFTIPKMSWVVMLCTALLALVVAVSLAGAQKGK